MTEERKIQLGVEVDATGAQKGFDQVKTSAQAMAQAVGKAGTEAAKGLGGMADAGQKLNTSQSRIVESIKRASIAATEGKAALLEYKAGVAGVSDVAAPYIAKLKQMEQGTQQLGVSAKQTAAALRGVPAQLTDIVTSLQGGQAPLTVLLQQGGQLKDMFGGIVPAAKALGGVVAGLVTPLTVTAGVLAAVGIAAYKGSEELRAFQAAVTITGNAIGASASGFGQLRDSIAGIGATRGKAAEVLTEIAAKGNLTGSSIRGIAEAAILMEKATGQATAKTIEQFSELARSPAEASAKLNEQYNFLTTAVYRQIKALEDQGRAVEAANLAEETYASAIKGRAQTVIGNAGLMEKAWRGITGAAKGAWDAMLNVGRDVTPADRLAKAAADVARIQAQIAGAGTFGETGGGAATGGASAVRKAALQAELASANQVLAAAQKRVEVEASNTAQKAEQNRLEQLGIDFTKQGQAFLGKEEQKRRELLKAEKEGRELVAAGIIKESELTSRLNAIREKYKETGSGAASGGENQLAALRARAREEEASIQRLRGQLADPSTIGQGKTTQAEKDVLRLQEELRTSIKGVAREQKELALVEAQGLVVKEQTRVALEKQVKAVQDSIADYDKLVAATGNSANSIRDQAIAQEAANANLGKSKTAIEQATLAQLKLSAAEAEASDRFAPAYVAAINAKVEAQQRFVQALQDAEFRQAKTRLDDAGRAGTDESETLQLRLSLLGQSEEVRARIVAQREVEVRLAKELAEIDKLNLGEGVEAEARREELRVQARQNAIVQANNATTKVVLDQWQKTSDQINNSLTDALLRGFEGGKDFAKNFRDTLKNMFKTLVLQPTIKAILSPVSQTLSGITNSFLGGIGGGGGGGGGFNLGSLFGGQGNGLGSIASLFGGGGGVINFAGSQIATGAGLGGALFGTGGGASALATSAGALEAGALVQGVGGTAGLAGVGGGAGSMLAALGPMAAFAAILFLAADMAKGEKRSGGEYGFNFDTKTADFIRGPSGGDPNSDGTKAIISATSLGLADAFKTLGRDVTLEGYRAGWETSEKGRGGVYAGGSLRDKSGNVIRFGEDGSGTNYDPRSMRDSKYEQWNSYMGQTSLNEKGQLQVVDIGNFDSNASPEKFATDVQQSFIAALQASYGLIPKIVEDTVRMPETLANAETGQMNPEWDARRFTRVFDDEMRQRVRELGEMPKRIQELILDIDPEALSAKATADVSAKLTKLFANVNGFRAVVDAMPVEALRSASFDAANSLVELSGGIEKFASNLSTYVDNFYTADEKQAQVGKSLQKQLQGIGLNFSVDQILGANRSNYRELVEMFEGRTDEAGMKTYAVLLSLAGAFASLTTSSEDAAQSIEGYYTSLERSISIQKQLTEQQRDAARALADTLRGLFDTLKSSTRELYGEVEDTRRQAAAQGQAFIAIALAKAKAGGALPGQAELSDAIESARRGFEQPYATQQDADFDRLVLAGKLKELQDITGDRLSAADMQLKVLEDQLKALDDTLVYWRQQIDISKGIGTGILSVSDAIKALSDALLNKGSSKPGSTPSSPGTSGASGGGRGGAAFGGGSGASSPPPNMQPGIVYSPQGFPFDLLAFGNANLSNPAAIRDKSLQFGVGESWWAAATKQSPEAIRQWFGMQGIPAFSQGANRIPQDMLAMVHKDEAIIPAAFNPWAGGGGGNTGGAGDQVRVEIRDVLKAMDERMLRLEVHMKRTADGVNGKGEAPILTEAA